MTNTLYTIGPLIKVSERKAKLLRIYIFKSERTKDLRAFAGDAIGTKLPENHAPWTKSPEEAAWALMRRIMGSWPMGWLMESKKGEQFDSRLPAIAVWEKFGGSAGRNSG